MTKERFKLPFAVYLLPKKNQKVCFSLRQNTGFMDGMFGLISGHVDGNEPAMDALVREAKEEAGIEIDRRDLRHACTVHRQSRDTEYLDLFFWCEKWKGEIQNMEPEKCSGLEWFSFDQLPVNVIPYVRDVIVMIERGETYHEGGF